MIPDLARADRAAAVRNAARAWRRAGVLDDTALAAVAARFPDDRVRVGPVFRILLFLFTVVAFTAGFGLVSVFAGLNRGNKELVSLAVLALLAGGAATAITELQIGSLRRRQGGTEAATSLMAVCYPMGAVLLWGFDKPHITPVFCLVSAAVLAAAAWRWGYPLYAGAATAALLVALAWAPFGRLLWIVLPLAAAPFLLRLAESPRLPPAHRASCTAVLLVALTGLYAAFHVFSWEKRMIEEIGPLLLGQDRPRGDAWWWLSAAMTALVPVLLLAFGIRGRRYPLLVLGASTAVASLVTLRWYVHVAPLWVVLTLSGVLLAGLVLGLRRFLESGPGGERYGFTAAPLFQDLARQRWLEAGAAIVTLSPAPRTLPGERRFEGQGGQFGGGGANGEF